ncbi:MAG TPA: hypothetical protein PLV43_09195, partial [Aequorivita sp.]|nr:hypothetical protein [Aequorivita sp.]
STLKKIQTVIYKKLSLAFWICSLPLKVKLLLYVLSIILKLMICLMPSLGLQSTGIKGRNEDAI